MSARDRREGRRDQRRRRATTLVSVVGLVVLISAIVGGFAYFWNQSDKVPDISGYGVIVAGNSWASNTGGFGSLQNHFNATISTAAGVVVHDFDCSYFKVGDRVWFDHNYFGWTFSISATKALPAGCQ
jgi:hypothetical protein